MAYRSQFNSHTTNRVPTYYAGNRLYPNSNAPLDAPTRTSRRIHDGLSLTNNYGLDTTSDDINSSPFSSPFYINGRYNGMEQVTQRGNSSSVQGITSLLMLNNEPDDFEESDIQTTIEMWQGKQIKFELPYNGKVVGNTITIKNTDNCSGILSMYFSTTDGGAPIYETAIDLCKVSQDKFEHITVYGNTPIPATANPRKKLYVRMEIWDEISMERSANPFNTDRKIEIAATGYANHYECVYRLTEKNAPVVEEYDYHSKPNRPCMGLIYNEWESIPTNRYEETDNGATVSLNGFEYCLFTIKNATSAKMVVYDKKMNKSIENTIAIDGRVTEVQLVQAKDYVYYVDGYSPLQKFKIGEWDSQTVTSSNPPVIAGSIICRHNNRIYLSGFRNDPNLVQATEITSAGPDYDSYIYRFYSPDDSPLATSTNRIVDIREYQSDSIMISTLGGHSVFSTNANIEDGMPTQVSTFTDGSGIQSSGDITNYRGVMYSFNPDEGIRRYTGAVWNKIPASVDSHIERVDMSKPRKLWGYANKLYFNYTDKIDGKYKCLIWDMDMNYQQYPWFQDSDMPFCDVRTDDDYDLIGIHPDFPCIMKLYDYDTWRRLDTPIVFERHTKYLSMPGNASDMVVKRVHTKVLANSNRWWNIGLSYDKKLLDQYRGKDIWYRIPCWDTIEETEPVETPFYEQDIYETKSVSQLSITNLRIQSMSIQVKIRCKTFRDQASLISIMIESQPRQFN